MGKQERNVLKFFSEFGDKFQQEAGAYVHAITLPPPCRLFL